MRRALLVLLSFVAVTSHARAQTSADATLAETLFRKAKKLMATGHAAEACPLFAESQRLDPGGGTLMNLALCYDAVGKSASAWQAMQDSLALAKRAKRDDATRVAEEKLRPLEAKLAYLTVDVADAARASGIDVTRDGVSLSSSSWGVEAPIDAGDHEIAATAPGHRPWRTSISIHDRDHVKVAVPLLEADAPPPSASAPIAAGSSAAPPTSATTSASPEPAAATTDIKRPLAYGAGALAIVAAGFGTYFGARALSYKSTRDAGCHDGVCNASGHTAEDQAFAAATASTVSFGVALGLLGASVSLFLLSAKSPSAGVAMGGSW